MLAQDNVAYAGQNGTPGLNGFTAQNVPGAQYRSESNFVLPVGTGQTAGLSDFGARLKAVFNSMPARVRLFVSVSNVANAAVQLRRQRCRAGVWPTDLAAVSRN